MPSQVKEQLSLGFQYGTNGNAEFRDAGASENKSLPVHRWVPWIAGFSAQFVEDAIASYLPSRNSDRQLILDPFAGVGTTLVEAVKAGRHAVGYEINAYAALAARAKLNCVELNTKTLRLKIDSMRQEVEAFESKVDRTWLSSGDVGMDAIVSALSCQRPAGFKSRIPFFSPPIEAKFLHALEWTARQRDPYKTLLRTALGATMVSFSNYTYEPSLSSRPGAGKPVLDNAPVAQILLQKLDRMLDDTRLMRELYGETWRSRRREVVASSYFDSRLKPKAVALIVTSPPYMNNYHYVRNTRPQLYWLNLVAGPEALRENEEQSFGKFWQTVRQGPAIELEVGSGDLQQAIERLRDMSSERGPYGGSGWANYVATYFNDCARLVRLIRRQLRPGGRAVIVVGNSIIQGIEFKVDQVIGELAEQVGLEVEEICFVRAKRVGNSIIDSSVRNGTNGTHRKKTQLYDAAVVLRR